MNKFFNFVTSLFQKVVMRLNMVSFVCLPLAIVLRRLREIFSASKGFLRRSCIFNVKVSTVALLPVVSGVSHWEIIECCSELKAMLQQIF